VRDDVYFQIVTEVSFVWPLVVQMDEIDFRMWCVWLCHTLHAKGWS